MLSRLTIQNYVLIDHLEMAPSKGLTIITGETGAGKSIMLGAVGLLLGNRADTKALLSSDKKCIIEGTFVISDYGMQALFDELDLDYEATTLIRREIAPSGKSRAFVNDTPVRLEALREIGEKLLNVHSQNETFNLGEQAYQLRLLDSYAQNGNIGIDYQNVFSKYKEAEARYKELLDSAHKLRSDQDYTQFVFSELETLNLDPEEQENLEEELKVLENSEEIKSNLYQAEIALSDSERGVLSSLADVKSLLKKIAPFSAAIEKLAERLESNYIDLSDLLSEIETESSAVDFEPQRAEEVSQRLSEIYRLQKKHNVNSIQELLDIQKGLEEKLSSTSSLDEDLAQLELEKEKFLLQTMELGEQISLSRQKISKKISSEVEEILIDLSIPDAKLDVDFERVAPTFSGIDHVTFKFSANKGIAPQDLKKVASGGEFSRLMFAVKYLMAGKTALPTIIFDEIDTGISGEVAKRLGIRMKKMGNNHQIVTITHLPQIAAVGEYHYFVYKQSDEKATASHIRRLTESERVDEIAKMIAGDNPSESAIESARELVSS